MASLYGHAGGDSTALFKQAAQAAARVGNAPYFLCMDANADIRGSPFLLQMTQEGWHNVAQGSPDEHAPTYATQKDWDRITPVNGATRIDYVFANTAGRHLVQSFRLLRDLPAKQHLGLQVTLDLHRFYQLALRFHNPVPYPTPPLTLRGKRGTHSAPSLPNDIKTA